MFHAPKNGRPPAWPIAVAITLLVGGITVNALTGCQRSQPAEKPIELPRIRSVSTAEAEQFLGNEACAECHSKQSEAHADSHHAHALTEVTAATHGERFRDPSDIQDEKRGLKYRTAVAGDDCVLMVNEKGRTGAVKARYGFGSGKHAITYMGDFRGELLELRLSHYTAARRWDFSPGQGGPDEEMGGGVLYPEGMVKAHGPVEECFVCHGTTIIKDGTQLRPDRSRLGVGCESCHGAGRAHVEAVRSGAKDLKMVRLSQARSRLTVELCGQCHRSPVADDLSHPFNQSQMPRLQGLALSQSACFTNSGGRLSCLTCHDPHSDAKTTRADYNRQCGSCHDGATMESRSCTIEPKGDCVSCHMPEQSVGMPTGLKYRTHWIKVWGSR